MAQRLERKIDKVLVEWKNSADSLPLIVRGARQVGKTEAIEHFARANYKYIVEINFILQQEYRDIFADGCNICVNISFLNVKYKPR
mgnify:CR=1 FL=1